jgi:hypothetical protein
MKNRILPHDATLNEDFKERVSNVETVYFRGLNRMPYSDLRSFFKELGFAPRELLHFSFLGGGITGIMCSNSVVAKKLTSYLSSNVHCKFYDKLDPSLPLPRRDGSFPPHEANSLAFSRKAYIDRTVKEIVSVRDLLVSTVLQREVPSCSAEITDAARKFTKISRQHGGIDI